MYLSDFCAWFQRQQAAFRLEMLVTMIQMLHPLELRFISACVEELARKDWSWLHDCELRTNNGQMVAQLNDLANPVCRSRLIIGLSLLYSGNYTISAVLYRILMNLKSILDQLPRTKDLFDEIALLLVMAKHHPTFRFDQKVEIAELLHKLSSYCNLDAMDDWTVSPSASQKQLDEEVASPVATKSTVDRATQAFEDQIGFCCTCGGNAAASGGDSSLAYPRLAPAYVKNIVAKGTRKIENEDVCDLQVTWSNGEETEMSKTLKEMYDFHRQLLDWYPRDAGACGSGRKIPYFPGYRDGSSGEPGSSDAILREVYKYVEDLVKFSPEILQSPYTINFLSMPVSTSPSSPIKVKMPPPGSSVTRRPSGLDPGSSEEGEFLDAQGRVKPLTIYSSHVSPQDRDAKTNGPKASPTVSREAAHEYLMQPPPSQKCREPATESPSSKSTTELTSVSSQTSTDLTQSVSTSSSGPGNGEQKSRRKSFKSQPFIPNPLYSALQREGLVFEYKRHLFPKTMEELWTMTDDDIIKTGAPFETCSKIVNAAKSCVHELISKQVNGSVFPKIKATDIVGNDVFPMLHGRRRSTPPVLDFRGQNAASDLVSVAAISGIPCRGVDAFAVRTSLPPELTNLQHYDLSSLVSAFPSHPTQLSSTDSTLADSGSLLAPSANSQSTPSVQGSLFSPFVADAATLSAQACSLNDPSVVSTSWIQPASEDDFPTVARSYSVDSGDTSTTTTAAYVVNLNNASSSLPPSQSQSPVPVESYQQLQAFFPAQPGIVMSTSAFSIQQSANQSQQYQLRPSKAPYRTATPHYGHKTGLSHQPTPIQRRSYVPALDYSRAQQPQLYSFIPTPQSLAAHPVALSTAIPAANFVRAPLATPPPSTVSTLPATQRLRLVCQQCNGTSTTCPLCSNGSWSNGLLTPAGGPVVFQFAQASQPPPTSQLFSPPFLSTQTSNNPLTIAQFFTSPPPVQLASALAVAASGSPPSTRGAEEQHFVNVDDKSGATESTSEDSAKPTHAAVQSCSNCGFRGHSFDSCAEPALVDLTSSNHFRLNFAAKDDTTSNSVSQDR